MSRLPITALFIAALFAMQPALAATSPAPPDGKQVPTQSITVPQDDDGDAGDGTDAAPAAPPATNQADEPIPTIEYDITKLPPAVQKLRQQLIDAATTGDIEKLRPIMQAGPQPPNLGADDGDNKDPIEYLKSLSGDPDGRELLAILLGVLDAGYVHVDVGTPEEAYVWPYFARYPIDKLTPPQMVELFRLLTASDFDEMKNFGAYLFYRVGITPDGHWSYFEAGD